jgi:hypothetical protein
MGRARGIRPTFRNRAWEPESEEAAEPEPFYKDLVSFVQEIFPRPTGAASPEPTERGGRRGGNTKKPSADWKLYGGLGNFSALTAQLR